MPRPCAHFAVRIPVMLAVLWNVACTSNPDRGAAPDSSESALVLFSDSPLAWYNAYFTDLEVAPDGERAFFDYRRLVDLTTGAEISLGSDLDAVFTGTFDPLGRPIVRGRRGDERGWFRIDDSTAAATLLESVPATASLAWSSSGKQVVYWSNADPMTLFIGPGDGSGEVRAHPLSGTVSAATWLPEDAAILVLVQDERGVSRLHELDPATAGMRTVADGLDGPSWGVNIAVSDDGRFAYLALASDGAPDPEARHEPDADRDLDIYEIDLTTGHRRPVVQTPAEELAPEFAGGALHWVAITTRMEVVLVPMDGGEARVVAENVQGPSWRPDGLALGVTTGDWRVADWALNLDGGVVEIDADGRTTSPVVPFITGYHEDFSPVWSPDGTWIAYHSHRSPGPVARYGSEGSTDDIYVRRPDAPTSEEIRLTDFGIEVGTPDWAPDGRRLLLDSWEEGGGASAWIVEMDPETGALVDRRQIPRPPAARGTPAGGSWSPVREEIALVLRDPGGEMELWILAPDGSSARRIATYPGPWFGGVDWSADGESLVYAGRSSDRSQLFSIPRAGGEPRRLTEESASLFHPQVSPDGRWVAATRIRHEKRILRLAD